MGKSLKEFYESGGIIQPIRAIVSYNLIDYDAVAKTTSRIEMTLCDLKYGDEEKKETAKLHWASLLNKSNVIGYFSAIKLENGDVQIGYSLCKPSDWDKFDHEIGKQIAINKRSNLRWVIHKYDMKEEPDPWVETCVYTGSPILNRNINIGIIRNDYIKTVIMFNMLGTFWDQFNHFTKRVIKYYKLDK